MTINITNLTNETETDQEYEDELCAAIDSSSVLTIIYVLLNLVGLILNLTNILVLNILVYHRRPLRISETRKNNKMYKFLIIESAFESYFCLCILGYFSINYRIKSKHLAFIQYIFFYYGSYVAMQMSVLCKMGACIIRFRTVFSYPPVKSRLLCLFKNFNTVLIIMFLFSTVSYTIHLVDINRNEVIKETTNEKNVSGATANSRKPDDITYLFTDNILELDNRFLFLSFLNSMVRYTIIIICILVINIFTLVKTKKFFSKKRSILSTSIGSGTNSNKINKRYKLEIYTK
jgi:hypothetical protein